jgi:hypothetical protein
MYPGAVAVMFADPTLTPLTWGCVVGVVAPAATVTLLVTETVDVLLLVRVTVSPPAGAGVARVTGNEVDAVRPTLVPDGRVI